MSKSLSQRFTDLQRINRRLSSNREVVLVAQAALDAYEHRFGSSKPPGERAVEDVNLVGPIDDEMIALRKALT